MFCNTQVFEEDHVACDVNSFALKGRNGNSETAETFLDTWTHVAAMTLIEEVRAATILLSIDIT